MSIFGRQNLPVLGAMLSDVGANLRGNQGSALAALEAKRKKEADMMAAQQWQAGLFANGAPSREDFGRAILTAPQGANINQLSAAYELMTPEQKAQMQAINVGNGTTGIFDPNTGNLDYQSAPNPSADLERELALAQIEAAKALARQRGASAGYSDAKARQPYAPPRASGGASAMPKPGKGPPVISSREQFNALPSGAVFKAPDGTTRRKP